MCDRERAKFPEWRAPHQDCEEEELLTGAVSVRSIIGMGSTTMVSLPIYADPLAQDLHNRLIRAEGQIRGVAKMVAEQRPCMEVLQQLASVQAALRGVTKTVLRNYLERCVTAAIRSGEAGVYDELMNAIYKFAK